MNRESYLQTIKKINDLPENYNQDDYEVLLAEIELFEDENRGAFLTLEHSNAL